jgi:prepilin-type N-terminal cleavage/methylation domain-containing protein
VCSSAGFTLVELIVVTALIGVLATLAIPTYNNFIDRARNARAKSEVRLLETEINAYRFDIGALPANLAAINRADLLDPWGNRYVYSNNPRIIERYRFDDLLNDDYDLFSKGKDGLTPEDGSIAEGTTGADDLIRGSNGIFVGAGLDF